MKKIVLVFCVLMLSTTVSFAVPLGNYASHISDSSNSPQTSLQEVVDATFQNSGINVYTDQTGVGLWTGTDGGSASAFEVARLGWGSSVLKYGLYDAVSGAQYAFDQAAENSTFYVKDNGDLVVNSHTVAQGWSGSWGFYLDGPGYDVAYTEDDKNTQGPVDGINEAVSYIIPTGTTGTVGGVTSTYTGNNDWIIAFDVNPFGTDYTRAAYDYQDLVLVVKDMAPVPEPATLVLLGSGLVGLAFLKRRKS